METLTLKKRRGRPPKDSRKPVEPKENPNMIIRANVFIPGELPFEVKYEVTNFLHQTMGPHSKPDGVKEALYKALVATYGNIVT